MQKHNNIDEALKKEKARATKIKRVFLLIDITIILMQLSTMGILTFEFRNAKEHDEKLRTKFEILLLPSILEVVFSLLLVVAACYIKSWVRKSTGKNKTSYLLRWHIVNLFILIIVNALKAKLANKVDSSSEDDKDF